MNYHLVAVSLKELFGVWQMSSLWSGDEVYEGKEDKIDAEMCSESWQDSDVDGSECKGGVEDL